MSDLAIVPIAGQLGDYKDPTVYVELALARAKEWLIEAVEHGEIDQIVELKSQAEAIRSYTVQKQLGKDAELNAQEIVRRAERGLGLAIRKGQAEGTIASQATSHRNTKANQWGPFRDGRGLDETAPTSPSEYLDNHGERADVYAITDDVSDDQFENVITEAREEKNLSRANVVRKVKGEAKPKPADRSEFHYRTRRIDAERVIEETVNVIEAMASGLSLIREDIPGIDIEKRLAWIEALRQPLAVINHFRKELAK